MSLSFNVKIAFFFLLLGGFSHSQSEFKSKKYHFSFQTNLDSIGTRQLESLVDTKIHSIYFISLNANARSSYFDYYTNKVVDLGFFSTIIRGNKKIEKDRINTVVKLKPEDYSELFTILYSPIDKNSRGSCYMPRHGIVFCDSKEEAIGFIEICFECSNIQVLTLFTPDFNQETLADLKKLFQKYMSENFER